MRIHVVFALLAAMAVVYGCGTGEGPAPADPVRAELARIVEAARVTAGAETINPPDWYGPQDLFEYINGMADYYLEAGFKRLVHAEFQKTGDLSEAYVEVDIYDMGTPQGAEKVMADARTPTTQTVSIGDEAHKTPAGIDLRAGRYYVRIVARRDEAGQQDLVRKIAEGIAAAVRPAP